MTHDTEIIDFSPSLLITKEACNKRSLLHNIDQFDVINLKTVPLTQVQPKLIFWSVYCSNLQHTDGRNSGF